MVVPVPESVLKKSKTLASIQEKRQAALKKLVAVSFFNLFSSRVVSNNGIKSL